jgi:hypothetical protein
MSTSAATVKDKQSETPPADLPRKLPVIPPDCIAEHGERCREWFIALPPGVILDDLQMPAIWRHIQSEGNHKRLGRFDRLTIVSHDASWMVEARVAASTSEGASIAIVKKFDLPERTESLPETSTHRIIYSNLGYQVVHKRTNGVVGVSHANIGSAVRVLYEQTPRKVA